MKKTNAQRQADFRKNLASSGRKKINLVVSIEADCKLMELARETGYTRNQLVEQMIKDASIRQDVSTNSFLNPR